MKKKLKKYIKEQYDRDKRWCTDHHNKGDLTLYNMIFGRLQSLVGVDTEMELGLGLREDMLKNVPWNDKMLPGHRQETHVSYTKEDIINLNKSV